MGLAILGALLGFMGHYIWVHFASGSIVHKPLSTTVKAIISEFNSGDVEHQTTEYSRDDLNYFGVKITGFKSTKSTNGSLQYNAVFG